MINNTIFKSIHAYECSNCGTTVGINVKIESLICPECNQSCRYISEGFMAFSKTYNLDHLIPKDDKDDSEKDKYPFVLTAKHISEILDISERIAYEIMDSKDFPLLKIGRHKKVTREAFFKWLDSKQS